jgi:hypothetical protein
VRQLTDPIVRHINLIDVSLQGWPPGKVRGKCSLAVYQTDGPDEKLLAQLLAYAGDNRENYRTRFSTRPQQWDGADAMARDWFRRNEEIGSKVELITDPHNFIACRLLACREIGTALHLAAHRSSCRQRVHDRRGSCRCRPRPG